MLFGFALFEAAFCALCWFTDVFVTKGALDSKSPASWLHLVHLAVKRGVKVFSRQKGIAV